MGRHFEILFIVIINISYYYWKWLEFFYLGKIINNKVKSKIMNETTAVNENFFFFRAVNIFLKRRKDFFFCKFFFSFHSILFLIRRNINGWYKKKKKRKKIWLYSNFCCCIINEWFTPFLLIFYDPDLHFVVIIIQLSY